MEPPSRRLHCTLICPLLNKNCDPSHKPNILRTTVDYDSLYRKKKIPSTVIGLWKSQWRNKIRRCLIKNVERMSILSHVSWKSAVDVIEFWRKFARPLRRLQYAQPFFPLTMKHYCTIRLWGTKWKALLYAKFIPRYAAAAYCRNYNV